jgi:hypothetical protein
VRRLTLLAAFAAAGGLACASSSDPPGGPPDQSAPYVVRVTPDSGRTGIRPPAVEFFFNETVSDRVSRGELDQFFLVSPTDGIPRVSWHRSRITVRPRRGFRPNVAYTVTMLPGLADIRGNVMKNGKSIAFSTGPTFPRFGIEGRIFDWAAERPLAGALVLAISRPDSVVYLGVSDSLGAYAVGPFGPGRYTLLSFLDRNNNRERDRDEPWDSTQVVVSVSRPVIDLLAIVKDSIPPRLTTVTREDSTSIHATFDRPVDPSQRLGAANFRVQRADSTVLPVVEVLTLRQVAARAEAQNARSDTAARPDTSARQPPTPAVPLPAPVNPGRPPAPPTATVQKPKVPPPENGVVLRLPAGTLLSPGTMYRVTATGVRNLLGRPGTSTRTFTIPRAVADTSRRAPAGAPRPGVPRDTTRRPP